MDNSLKLINTANDLNMPDVINTDAIIDSYDKSKLPALAFTREILAHRPELLGNNIQNLLYALFGGLEYSVENVFLSFKTFLTTHNKQYIELKENGNNNLSTFLFDSSFIIQYAKVLQTSDIITNFEPIYEELTLAMKTWMVNSSVIYNGKSLDARLLKGLCYNANGDYFFDLLPYICFIVTFLLNCSPYRFMSSVYEAQGFTFLTSLNNHINKGYLGLGKDLGINVQANGLSALSNIDDKYFIDLFNVVLNANAITELRNEYMSQSEGLLDTCIQEQYGITKEHVLKSFQNNMSLIFEYVIEYNPFKAIYDKLPVWNNDLTPNTHELMLWTEYALAGGDKHLAILDNGEQLINYACNDEDYEVLPKITTRPFLPQNNIKKLGPNAIKSQPFSSNDIVLKLIMAQVHKEYNAITQDIFEENPFTFSELLLKDNCIEIAASIQSLYINGLWAKDGPTMYNASINLCKHLLFSSEITNLLSLQGVLNMVYKNPIANATFIAFILGLINEALLNTCIKGKSLKNFSIISYLIQLSPQKYMHHFNKLADMAVSLTMLLNEQYVEFINKTVDRFLNDLTVSKHIFMVFVKGLRDMADIYAIGGCELYNTAKISNPIIRAYYWYLQVNGLNSEIYTIFKFVQTFNNGALFELLDEYKNNEIEYTNTVKYHITNIYKDLSKLPLLLSNFLFTEDGEYSLITQPYVLEYKSLQDLAHYIFTKSSIAQVSDRHIIFKEIKLNNFRNISVAQSTEDIVIINNRKYPVTVDSISNVVRLPVYDLSAEMQNIGVSIMSSSGYRLEWLTLLGNKSTENATVVIATNAPVKTRFQKYEFDNSAKPRLTKLKQAALVKKQNEFVQGAISSAMNLANDGY